MTDPLVVMESIGRPLEIKYSLPDSTSFSGNHIIELVFDTDPFLPIVSGAQTTEPKPALTAVGNAQTRSWNNMVIEGNASAKRPVLLDGVRYTALTGLSMDSSRIEERHADLVASLGYDVHPVSSASGHPSYVVLAQIKGDSGSVTSPDGKSITGNLPSETAGELGGVKYPVILISSPANKTIFVGPSTGVRVKIIGRRWVVEHGTSSESLKLGPVEVCLNNGAYRPAKIIRGQLDDWEAEFNITTSGSHTLTARVSLVSEDDPNVPVESVTASANVIVQLAAKEVQPPDRPVSITLEVTQPPGGTALVSAEENGQAEVEIKGTAAHPTGVHSVEIILDSSPNTPILADTNNNFQTWSCKLTLTGLREHVITVRAKASNIAAQEMQVRYRVFTHLPRTYIERGLYLVETYQLSNYLGRYGAGRVIKTFTLLPGEKTRITIKSYRREVVREKSSSSIFDSLTANVVNEFQTALNNEQGSKNSSNDSVKTVFDASGEATWGWGSVKASVNSEWASNAARENFAKCVSNAASKHAQQTNSVRNLTINTESDRTVEAGLEETLERELSNINVGRVLNFIFRQMNQEYISVLHLVDARVTYLGSFVEEGDNKPKFERVDASVAELGSLLNRVIKPDHRQKVSERIYSILQNQVDYDGVIRSMIELYTPRRRVKGRNQPIPEASYYRINRRLSTAVMAVDDPKLMLFDVPGIALSVKQIILRTEGVLVETLLGEGEGLDSYSKGLQAEAVRERQIENDKRKLEVERERLAQKVLRAGDEKLAKIYGLLYPNKADVKFKILGPDDETTPGSEKS